MTLVPSERKVEMWTWDVPVTEATDRIMVTLKSGARIFFDGHDDRGFGGSPNLNGALFRLDPATSNVYVVGYLRRHMRQLLEHYREDDRTWRLRHWSFGRQERWIEEHVQFYIWPTHSDSVLWFGTLIKDQLLRVLPTVNGTWTGSHCDIGVPYIEALDTKCRGPIWPETQSVVADATTITTLQVAKV